MARTPKVSKARKALERELFEVLGAFNQSQVDFIFDLKRICELRIAILMFKNGCQSLIEERKKMIKRLDWRAAKFEAIPILVPKWVKLQHKKLLRLSDKALENKILRMKISISIFEDLRPSLYHQRLVLYLEARKLQQAELLKRKDKKKIGQQTDAEREANAIIQKMGSLLTRKQKRQLEVLNPKPAKKNRSQSAREEARAIHNALLAHLTPKERREHDVRLRKIGRKVRGYSYGPRGGTI